MRKIIRRDPTKCIQCRSCETMLTGFISEYEGVITLSPEQVQKEATQAAIDDLVSCCIGSAIRVETIL